MSSDDKPLTFAQSVRYGVGALAVLLAFALFGAVLIDALFRLPVRMPGSFHTNRPLWLLGAAALLVAGWFLQAPPIPPPKSWTPARPGQRFRSIRIYGREECHLCDNAADLLEKYYAYLPPLELINIDEDPALVERFGQQVPVVECDGKIRFRGRVDEMLLRRLIEGTPPQ